MTAQRLATEQVYNAAPFLLKALEELMKGQQFIGRGTLLLQVDDEKLDKAKAAIKMARSES